MLIFTYDGTFAGLLTCIFEAYNSRQFPDKIDIREKQPVQLFAEQREVISDNQKAERVWNGIQRKSSRRNKQMIFHAFLSEERGIEIKIMRFARRLFNEGKNAETDLGDADVLDIVDSARKVKKEAHRIKMFVRLQKTKDGIYFGGIDPLYDILPLVIDHFRARYADQQWLIYDLKRKYGAFFNKKTVEEVVLSPQSVNLHTGKVQENILEEDDAFYQTLWKSYFKHISIGERRNLRLQRQNMPRRFWKYLTEKQG